jgi:uncharacterized RmlC-like cupin family protein
MAECRLIRVEGFRGKQGLDYFAGISAESTGSKAICMHLLEMPPGASARPHYHESHETAIFVLRRGRDAPRAQPRARHGHRRGGLRVHPCRRPHQPYNPSDGIVRR